MLTKKEVQQQNSDQYAFTHPRYQPELCVLETNSNCLNDISSRLGWCSNTSLWKLSTPKQLLTIDLQPFNVYKITGSSFVNFKFVSLALPIDPMCVGFRFCCDHRSKLELYNVSDCCRHKIKNVDTRRCSAITAYHQSSHRVYKGIKLVMIIHMFLTSWLPTSPIASTHLNVFELQTFVNKKHKDHTHNKSTQSLHKVARVTRKQMVHDLFSYCYWMPSYRQMLEEIN